jgi:ATP-binding cassette subfamily B protein
MPRIVTWNDETALLDALARRSGMDEARVVERLGLYGGDLEATLQKAGAGVIDLGEGKFIGLLGSDRILDPDLTVRRVTLEEIIDCVLAASGAGIPADIEAELLNPRARRALLCARLYDKRIGWLRRLTLDPGTGFFRQFRDAGLMQTLVAFVAAHALETCLWLGVWWAAGQAALSGRLDKGWMTGWMLLLAALVPVRVMATKTQGRLSIGASGLLKQRLLAGALRLEPGQVAHEGAGRFFSRVTEAATVEALALSGGLMSAVSLVETAMAAAVLSLGASGWLLLVLFAIWFGAAAVVVWRYAAERSRWTDARLELTHDAVEQMTGHRTRLAQELAAKRHAGEDDRLERYHAISARLDRWGIRVATLIPYGWLLIGIAALMPAFVSGAPAAGLAVGLGGILLGQEALKRLTSGAANLAGAWISWQRVAPLFHAAARLPRPGIQTADQAAAPATVLEGTEIRFRYREGGPAVLDGLALRIMRGDWVLLEGESGRGKSTLVSILAGLREPSSGLLTSGSVDRNTLGASAWRRRIAAAPQYHENHILTGTLAFNLLMGRSWPPAQEDMKDAREVCQELGLGPLLERMPGGMFQMVGETGWQLSQGERSRVFLARALLQRSEMVILDESFAALDPENLRQAMECTLRRAKTLMVVAHP